MSDYIRLPGYSITTTTTPIIVCTLPDDPAASPCRVEAHEHPVCIQWAGGHLARILPGEDACCEVRHYPAMIGVALVMLGRRPYRWVARVRVG